MTLDTERGLNGTKLGCGEGGCGACTVMLSHWEDGKPVHRSVNACLCPLYAVEGMQVVTVEGEGTVPCAGMVTERACTTCMTRACMTRAQQLIY